MCVKKRSSFFRCKISKALKNDNIQWYQVLGRWDLLYSHNGNIKTSWPFQKNITIETAAAATTNDDWVLILYWAPFQHFMCIKHLNLSTMLWGRYYYYTHFSDEKTKAQGASQTVTCKQKDAKRPNSGAETRQCSFKSLSVTASYPCLLLML